MKNDTIHFRCSELDKENAIKQAAAKQMTLSEYILYLIRKDIDNDKDN